MLCLVVPKNVACGSDKILLFFVQTSLQLGSKLLKGLGVMSDDVSFLSQLLRDSMELQAQAVNKTAAQESDVMKSLQVCIYLCTYIQISVLLEI